MPVNSGDFYQHITAAPV